MLLLGEHWTTEPHSGFTKLVYTGTLLRRSRLTSSNTKLAPVGELEPGQLGSTQSGDHDKIHETRILSLTGPEERKGVTVG